jgi:hypothetical protein
VEAGGGKAIYSPRDLHRRDESLVRHPHAQIGRDASPTPGAGRAGPERVGGWLRAVKHGQAANCCHASGSNQ